MQTTDKIADLLTRIRNANSAKHESVNIPSSNMKKSILEILLSEGYIKRFTVSQDDRRQERFKGKHSLSSGCEEARWVFRASAGRHPTSSTVFP